MSDAKVKVFGDTKSDFELPKINVTSTNKQQESDGREVNLNKKNGGLGKNKTSTITPKNSGSNNLKVNNSPNSCSQQWKKMNIELGITPKINNGNSCKNSNEFDKSSNCTYEIKSSSTLKNSSSQKNATNIALNLNLALNMDYAKKNKQKNLTISSDSGILDTTPTLMDIPSSIKVAVRMRPLAENEKSGQQKNGKITDLLIKDNKVMIPHKKELFEFDYCLDSSNLELFNYASQEVVYRKMGQPLLDYAFQGYNVCLFAYGQSGSGKTYTMLGTDENPGIIPRFINDLFRRINVSNDTEFIVNISFLEIYNEKINDLLSDEFDMLSKKMRVREHPQTGPYVEDLTVYTVGSFENAMELMKSGLIRRSTGSTNSNEISSRSHSIFNIILVQNKKINQDNDPNVSEISCISKINLVDLAGSERVGASNSDRFRESIMINKSLLTLGKVISQLAENSNGKNICQNHVPYRESVLTYLLKDSLGGNSRTSMIATISPAKIHLDETISTLRYASTAQKIINIVRINEDPKIKIINGLLKQISFLQKEVDKKKTQNGNSPINSDGEEENQIKTKTGQCCKNTIRIVRSLKDKFKCVIEQQQKCLNEIEKMKQDTSKNLAEFECDKIEKLDHSLIGYLKSVVNSVKKIDYLKDLPKADTVQITEPIVQPVNQEENMAKQLTKKQETTEEEVQKNQSNVKTLCKKGKINNKDNSYQEQEQSNVILNEISSKEILENINMTSPTKECEEQEQENNEKTDKQPVKPQDGNDNGDTNKLNQSFSDIDNKNDKDKFSNDDTQKNKKSKNQKKKKKYMQ